jgi:hypothetical protein
VTAPPRRRGSLAAGGLLAAVVLAAFLPVVLGRRSFFHLDLYYEHLPVWAATQRALRAGASPFWLDGEYCGQPSLFIQEAPLFYPPMVPLLETGAPVHRLADAFLLFHYWLAGLAAFLFVRHETGRWLAGLFGGIAWMLSARMIQSATWPNAVAVGALLPLLLLGLSWIGRGRRRNGVLLLAGSGGLALLAARPHVLVAAVPVLAAMTLVAVWAAPRRLRAAGDVLLAAVLALLLGAPSWMPSAALLPETSLASGLRPAERDVRALATGPDLELVFLPFDGIRRWPETAAYPGVAAGLLFLAGVVVLFRKSGASRTAFAALAAGGAVGFLFAFGEKGPYGLFAGLPLLSGFRVPARYLFSWSLALALGSALVLGWWLARSRRPRLTGVACVLVLAADLVIHARSAAPTAPEAVYRIEPALVAELSGVLGRDSLGFPRRYVSVADTIYPIYYSGDDLLRMARRFEPMKFSLGMRFGLESVNGYGPTLSGTSELLSHWTARSAALAGVGAVVESAPAGPGEPPGVARRPVVRTFPGLPRAILVPEARIAAPGDALRAVLDPALDPLRTVVLESGEPFARGPAWDDGSASVKLLAHRPGHLSLEASLPDRGALVIFDSWEAGWKGTVDGRIVDVERADGAFRALRLSAGAHHVELDYRARGVPEGFGLAVVGLLGATLAARRLPAAGAIPSDILRADSA